MLTTRLSHHSSLLLVFALFSLLDSANAGLSAILNTTGYSNSSTTVATVAPATSISTIPMNSSTISPTITLPSSTTTIPSSILAVTTPSLLLTTETATGANGAPTTVTSLVIAGGSGTGMLGTVTEAGTASTSSPGLQSSASSRRVNGIERALPGVLVVATWMVVWC